MSINTKITKTTKVLLLSTLLSCASVSAAGDSMFALGAKIGTTGFGVDGRVAIAENLYGRFGVNYFQYTYSNKADAEEVSYNLKLKLLTTPLMLDYHPFDNSGFKVSLGVTYNGNSVSASAEPTSDQTINGNEYTKAQLGSITSKLTLGNSVAPILSVGYDNSLRSDSAWSFNAEAGVMYAGDAKVKVTATGTLADNPALISDLEKDFDKSIGQINKYLRFYPVVSVGVRYNF